jgi:hypothetical protein
MRCDPYAWVEALGPLIWIFSTLAWTLSIVAERRIVPDLRQHGCCCLTLWRAQIRPSNPRVQKNIYLARGKQASDAKAIVKTSVTDWEAPETSDQ